MHSSGEHYISVCLLLMSSCGCERTVYLTPVVSVTLWCEVLQERHIMIHTPSLNCSLFFVSRIGHLSSIFCLVAVLWNRPINPTYETKYTIAMNPWQQTLQQKHFFLFYKMDQQSNRMPGHWSIMVNHGISRAKNTA